MVWGGSAWERRQCIECKPNWYPLPELAATVGVTPCSVYCRDDICNRNGRCSELGVCACNVGWVGQFCNISRQTVITTPLCAWPAGEQFVRVKPDIYGFAWRASHAQKTLRFRQELRIVSYTPFSASAEGGRLLTVTGAGFSPELAKNHIRLPCNS